MNRTHRKTGSVPATMEHTARFGYEESNQQQRRDQLTPPHRRGRSPIAAQNQFRQENMRRGILGALAIAMLAAVPLHADVPVSLRGSNAAMIRQHTVALDAGYTFVRSARDVEELEASGELVRLHGNDDYGFREGVRSMVGRPEMKVFIERLSAEYRAACGEKLVLTSMTRPLDRQPRNSHRLSVHPAGIAVDLRVSRSAACRSWLEQTLMEMEEEGLLDGIRERSPPHYHVALFPRAYMAHIEPVLEAERSADRVRLAAERLNGLRAASPIPTESMPDRRPLWRILALIPASLLAAFVIGRGSRRPLRP
jgi:hypothetical protein